MRNIEHKRSQTRLQYLCLSIVEVGKARSQVLLRYTVANIAISSRITPRGRSESTRNFVLREKGLNSPKKKKRAKESTCIKSLIMFRNSMVWSLLVQKTGSQLIVWSTWSRKSVSLRAK